MGSKKKILFIEDDLPTIEVYTIALKAAGFELESKLSGREAVEKIKQINEEKAEKPDLILLDYILPDIDGEEVIKEIKKGKNTKDIRVFITTNYSTEELKRRGKLADGKKFILKADYPPSKMVELIKKELSSLR